MTRNAIDLSVYLVTDAAACGDRGVLETVRAAVAGGVTTVQLRDHAASTRSLYAEALALRDLLDGTGVPLVVDDRLDVALAAGAAGVHLGQSDLPAEVARALAGPELVIGWSVSAESEVSEVARFREGTVDYLGVGPIRATATKPNAAAPIGFDGLARLVSLAPVPSVAIGGLTVSDAPAVVRAGAVGVAVVSAICAADDPEAAARAFRRALSA